MSRELLAQPLKPKPLSRAERKWIDDLQAVLARCPRRLELVTIGDASLQVIEDSGMAGRLLAEIPAEVVPGLHQLAGNVRQAS
mgnify:CR=1 FL=1